MSQQVDALKASDYRQGEEEGHGFLQYNKPLDKANSHAFVSSKGNTISSKFIHHVHQNSFMDDDLATWLQYPLDDVHDIFQHWALPSPPLPFKDLPHHQQNDASMVDVIASDDGSVDHNCKTSFHNNSHVESSVTALLGSQGTQELSVMIKQVSRAKQCKDIGAGSSAAPLDGKHTLYTKKPSSQLSLPYQDRKDDVVFSRGSETSESLKEITSGSKRKQDDSECQSEDAEGESDVNSQARSSSSKRTRANEVHNLSERRRRNRINDKMNALRELIPNATKSNKAALLDEAIDYLKQLQLQLQVISMRMGVSLSPMVLPPGLPHMQMPQVSPTHSMGIGMIGGYSPGTPGLRGAGPAIGVVAMPDIMYGVPVRTLTNLTSSDPAILQLNTGMYNTYLQPQQLQHHHQEPLASQLVQASSQLSPSSQQQSRYKV